MATVFCSSSGESSTSGPFRTLSLFSISNTYSDAIIAFTSGTSITCSASSSSCFSSSSCPFGTSNTSSIASISDASNTFSALVKLT